jgi:hypothetical protein
VLLSLKVCERNGIKVLFVARKGCLAEGRESQKINKTLNEREKQKNSKKRTFRVKTKKRKSMNSSSDDDDSDDDDDLFYAPSYKTRRKEREESARRDFSLEDNNNNSNNTSSSNSSSEEDGDGIDDGKKRRQSGGEREEEERKRRCLMSDDDDDDEEGEGKEKETTARVGAETKVSDSDTDGEKTESEKYNDDKLREASALMRELTKKTDARELEDDEGFVVDDDEDDDNDNNNNDGARVSDVNNAGDDDDNMRYEPIQLVFAFSNTNRVEFETSKRYTFERIWKDFVKEHQSKGDIAKAKLTFDGDRIKISEDTPESLDMDDEDVIDVNA